MKNTLLFISAKVRSVEKTLTSLEQHLKQDLKGLLVVSPKNKHLIEQITSPKFSGLVLNPKSPALIQAKLASIRPSLLAATCHSEALIPFYRRIIPHIPYVLGPTESSLEWATDKLKMRQLLKAYDKRITPAFTLVADASDATVEQVTKRVGFPLIVKPTGLAESLLVSQCYYGEELQTILKKSFKKIANVYRNKSGRGQPQMLIEQLMEGSVYSTDVYVNSKGKCYFCPLVHVATGKTAGFDDFFGYKRLTPVKLKPEKQKPALAVAKKGIRALGLRNVSCHVELVRDDDNWRIIEIGPRMGGFRHRMYALSYGINHALNDVLIRMDKKPLIPRRVKGYSCVMQFYAKQEGIITKFTGNENIKHVASLIKFRQRLFKGDRARFARNGGGPAAEVTLFSPNRSDLLADIRRVEQILQIKAARRKQ